MATDSSPQQRANAAAVRAYLSRRPGSHPERAFDFDAFVAAYNDFVLPRALRRGAPEPSALFKLTRRGTPTAAHDSRLARRDMRVPTAEWRPSRISSSAGGQRPRRDPNVRYGPSSGPLSPEALVAARTQSYHESRMSLPRLPTAAGLGRAPRAYEGRVGASGRAVSEVSFESW